MQQGKSMKSMMSQKAFENHRPSTVPENRVLSQIAFFVIGLGIITGGIWSLYMGDAPYHPDDVVSQDRIVLISD
jgi:hypothetical protein